MTALIAARDSHDVLFLLAVLLVLGALAGAAYCAYLRNFVGAAVVAAVLLGVT
jgi:hypothetical protein